MSEAEIMREIMVKASEIGNRLFRNNVGTGWVGQVLRPRKLQSYLLGESDVIVKNARPLHAGLCNGSSDTIGWRSIVITPDMVGKRFAQFAACEVKAGTRETIEQRSFMTAVRVAGGWAETAHSPEEYAEKSK